MRNDMRNKQQKQLTKMLRRANRSIELDNLWRGRFYVMQRRTIWEEFADGSGGVLHAQIRCYDKKTGYYKDFIYEYAPWLNARVWRLYMDILNNFIVEDVKVWELEDPRADTTSYADIKYMQNDRRRDNFYLNIEVWREYGTY